MFTIRRATQEDREGIWRAHFRAVSETCATHYSRDVIRIWAGGLRPEKYEAAIRGSEFFVAEEGGAVVGFAELDRETGEVQGLYVSPEVAGRGVGRALLGKLEEVARARGLDSMHLTSSLNAVSFYERAGFVPTGTETKTLGPGVERASVKMRKALPRRGDAGVREPKMNEVILKSFERPDEVREFERGRFEIVRVGGMTVGRATYQPGWKWSEHVAPLAGTPFCEVEHVGLVVSGRAVAAMAGGEVYELTPGDLFHVPAEPHDSWVVGDEPYVSLHFLGADSYTK